MTRITGNAKLTYSIQLGHVRLEGIQRWSDFGHIILKFQSEFVIKCCQPEVSGASLGLHVGPDLKIALFT